MEIVDWIPSVTTTSLLGITIWLGRNLILTRLQKAVETEFDQKLESIRSELRKSEERWKAELRIKESEIIGLRGSLMSAMTTRQIALEKKKLEAAELVWSAVVSLSPAKVISRMLATIKLDVAVEESVANPKVRQMFAIMGAGCDLKKLNTVNAHNARPFVSPMVWAVFSAYGAIVMGAAIRIEILKAGLTSKSLIDHGAITKLIKSALPHQSSFVDKFGEAGYHLLLEELEEKLLAEINDMLAGKESDKSSAEQAARILKLSNEVVGSLNANNPIVS